MNPSSLPSVTVTSVSDDALLLDVREDDEWAAGHAPGAVHVPLHQLPARVGELPTDRPVEVVCHFGGRSAQATVFLLQSGLQARNVEGGMDAWEKAGKPVVTDSGAPGRVV